jgi:hypothetical protein
MRRVVWERGVWLFLKRWGGLPEMVMTARHTRTGAAVGVAEAEQVSGAWRGLRTDRSFYI